MTDLVTFLEARLGEDEKVARAAEAEPFPDKGFQRGTHIVYGLQSTGLGLDYQGFALVWDPARVLAEIAAKRAIIDAHPNVNDGDCGTCVRAGWGYPTHGGSTIEHWPCPTLRLLAAPFADHPDFDESWRA